MWFSKIRDYFFCENEKKIATVIFRLIYFERKKRLLIIGSENLED